LDTTTYSCPTNSFVTDFNQPLVDFSDCTCFWGWGKTGAGLPAVGTCSQAAASTYSCPDNSHQSGWPIVDFTDCTCNYGFAKTGSSTAGTCNTTTTYTCPTNSYRTDWNTPLVDETGCTCFFGSTMTAGAGGVYSCVGASNSYVCPANSYQSSFPATDFTDCTCGYGYSKTGTSTAGTCQADPTIISCPTGSWANVWPPTSISDCTCNYDSTMTNGVCVPNKKKSEDFDQTEVEAFNYAMFFRETYLKNKWAADTKTAIAAFQADMKEAASRQAQWELQNSQQKETPSVFSKMHKAIMQAAKISAVKK